MTRQGPLTPGQLKASLFLLNHAAMHDPGWQHEVILFVGMVDASRGEAARERRAYRVGIRLKQR